MHTPKRSGSSALVITTSLRINTAERTPSVIAVASAKSDGSMSVTPTAQQIKLQSQMEEKYTISPTTRQNFEVELNAFIASLPPASAIGSLPADYNLIREHDALEEQCRVLEETLSLRSKF